MASELKVTLGPCALIFIKTLEECGAKEVWVKQAKDPIRYIHQLDTSPKPDMHGNTVAGGFSWANSQQGDGYWHGIFKLFRHNLMQRRN